MQSVGRSIRAGCRAVSFVSSTHLEIGASCHYVGCPFNPQQTCRILSICEDRTMSPTAADIGEFLVDRVRRRGINGVLYYNDVALQFGLPPMDGAWMSHPLCGYFHELDVDDHEAGRPFRTTLVIVRPNSTTVKPQIPGAGYFTTVGTLRFPNQAQPFRSDTDKEKFFNAELAALAQFYPKVKRT